MQYQLTLCSSCRQQSAESAWRTPIRTQDTKAWGTSLVDSPRVCHHTLVLGEASTVPVIPREGTTCSSVFGSLLAAAPRQL